MSHPARLPGARGPLVRAGDRAPGPAPSASMAPDAAHVLDLQERAGNRAVTQLLEGRTASGAGAPVELQRAPASTDAMVPSTGFVTAAGDEDDRPAPVPNRGGTTVAGDDDRPAPVQRPSPGPRPSAGPRPAQPPAGPPRAADPNMAGGVPRVQQRMWHRAAPTSERDAMLSYQRDPATVVRSPDRHWHWQMWNASQGPGKYGMRAPMVIRAGSLIIVHPSYQGPATVLPDYRGSNVGLGPVPGAAAGGGAGSSSPGAGTATPTGERPMARLPPDPAEARLRQAVAPYTPYTGEPRGSQRARPVTHSEVAAAMARDPGRVVRSPNARWHRQGYRLDGGGREAPGAFRVGDLYVIAPDYPLPGVPRLGESAPPKPSALPAAANPVALPHETHTVGSPLKSHSSTTTEHGGRTQTTTRTRELGVVTTATETSDGELTNRRESVRGAGVGVGGNLIGATAGSTESTSVEGGDLSSKRSTQVSGGLSSDLKLGAEASTTKERVIGTDPEGNPVKTSTTTKGAGSVDFEGWEAGAEREHTSRKGTTTGAGAKLKGDWDGNVEVEAFVKLQSKGGLSFKPTVSAGTKVEASEPVEVEGGFEVVYRIVDTTGIGAGGGKALGGGASLGVNVGATEGTFQGGRRTFRTKEEATAFRDNAARRVLAERALTTMIPVTSAAGALQIPIGDTRSSGDVSGRSIGASAGYSGVAVNVGRSSSSTHELAIKRIAEFRVEVTGTISGAKTGSVGISAPVVAHGYSSTGTTSFAVTYEFDLSKEGGRAAFERYCATGFPPMQAPKVLEKAGSDSDHETVSIPGLGSAVWTGTTWTVTRETAGGTTKAYGGAQIHEQKPGAVGKFLGEDTLTSNAQIVRVVKDGEEVGARAEFKVGGTSGEYNRAEFGKIFPGARTDGSVKASGEWTLSAPVPKENIRSLAQNSRRIRNAIDERQAYSELVKEGGARMLGGQVGMTSGNWDLELKGDPNFPGEKERVRLKDLRAALMARVRSSPDLARDIVRETGEEIDRLTKRRAAVADPKRYTDLPDGLRKQQLSVIDMHLADMKVVRRTAQAVAMKRRPGEKAADVAARLEREGKAGTARKPGAGDRASAADRDYARLQDLVAAKESRTAVKRREIRTSSRALGDAIGAKGTAAIRFGADTSVVQVAIASAKGYIAAATAADQRQAALDPRVEQLRDAWSATEDRPAQLAAIKALDVVLGERLTLMETCLDLIREAGKAMFPVTTTAAKAGNPSFWSSLGLTEGDEDEA